jgi:glycosyltransferase involved in cell wall biosynthesis
MDQPLVSIMIPTYNQAHWLGKAVESALAQDYQNIEIVIADDRSTDETNLLLNKYRDDNRVRIITNETNLGRVANYKHTLENHVRGEWVVNLDGDDHYTDNTFVSSAIKQICGEPDVVFLQAGHVITDNNGRVLGNALPSITGDFQVIDGTDYFLNFHHFSHLASIYNRKAATDVGFYIHDILSTDIECFLRLALNGKVILMHKAVGAWVHHDGNESKKLSVSAVENNMLRFTAPYAYAKKSGKIPDDVLNGWLKKNINSYLLNYLTVYFTSNDKIPGYLFHVLKKNQHLIFSIILPKAFLKGLLNKAKNLFQSKE